MSVFVPEKGHLREALLFIFHLKKKATDAHQMLTKAYGNSAPSIRTRKKWFQLFKSGDFDVNDKDHGKPPKKFENEDLQALLDKDDTQTQQQLEDSLNVTKPTICLRLQAMGKIQKEGNWRLNELTERNKEQRKTTCEILFERF